MPENKEKDIDLAIFEKWSGETENYLDIVDFGQYLIDINAVYTAEDIQYYYEKPWKWKNERTTWKKEQLKRKEIKSGEW